MLSSSWQCTTSVSACSTGFELAYCCIKQDKSTVRAYFGFEIGKRDCQAKLSCLVFPSLYGGPKKANHSYSWQIHAGLASEGMMPPFRRNNAFGMIKRPWTQPAFWGALPQWWLKSQPQTITLQLLQQEHFPRDWLWWRRACANLRWILSFIKVVFAEDVALWETGGILKLLK